MFGALSRSASAAEFDHVQSHCSVVFSSGPPLTVTYPNATTAGNLLIVNVGFDTGFDAGAVRTVQGLPLSLIRRTATADQVVETHWAIASGGPLTVDLGPDGTAGSGAAILFVHEYEGSAEPLRLIEANGVDAILTQPITASRDELVFAIVKSSGTTYPPAPPFTPRNQCGSDVSADVSRHDGGEFIFATTTNGVPWVAQLHVFGRRGAGPDAGSSDGGPSDGGPSDGGPSDGGPSDGGPTDDGPTDGGPTDGGPSDGGPSDGGSTDAGSLDAGPPAMDSGVGDAGLDADAGLLEPSDAGQLMRRELGVSCTSAPSSWCLVLLAVWAMRRVTSSTQR